MKKFLILLGAILVLFILAIILVPVLFKDDIQKALDQTMAESLNAKVYYDTDQFGLSLIKNFPDITVGMGDFGIVGIEEFANDTLVSIGSFSVTVDIMSAISGSQIEVKEFILDNPRIKILVLEDGKANYDIAKESTEVESEEPEENESGEMSIGINHWAINNGQVLYRDQSLKFITDIKGLNHEGSGDFTLELFDLETETTVDAISLGFDGVEYITNKSIEADVALNMDLGQMLFKFLDNRIVVNSYAMQADGSLSMPGDDIYMDITFGGKDIDLKSILSLIPGAYQEYLDGVSASGEINFDGFVKGTFSETNMPQIAANLSVSNGEVAYSEFDIPMENVNIQANFDYPSADLKETSFNIDNFSMLVDGEEVSAYLKFKNLEDYTWDFGLEGNADLEKITKIVPLEDMTLRGKLNAGLKSAGKMSILEAEQYENLPTSGNLTVDGFYFESTDLPQGFGISKASLNFDPSQISLAQFDATSGNSDFKMKGQIRNYIGFALAEDEVLAGSLSLSSNLIDLNEFMPETEEEEVVEDTTSLEVIKIPENIDFTFNSSIQQMNYTNLEIKDFQGKVLVKDGAIILDENSFKMLDGTFRMTGSYVTKDLDQPAYDLGFEIEDLSIANAFESFETIQEYVPIAKQVTGKFSTDFKVNGLLGSDMMPLMDEVNLSGLVNIAKASLNSGTFVTKLNTLTTLKSGSNSASTEKSLSLKDVLIATAIKDGRLFVEPFDLEVNGQKATVGGSNSLDGKLDYTMLVRDIPTGAIGNALNSALGSLTGGQNLVSDKIDLNLGILGTTDDPDVKLLGTSPSGSSGSTSTKEAFQKQITSKVDNEKAKAEAELEKKKEEQRQKIISEARARADKLRSEGKSNAEKVRKEGYAAADKLISDAGSNPIKKKVANEAAKKLRAETDKKADAIESEANKKADQLVTEAEAKTAKI